MTISEVKRATRMREWRGYIGEQQASGLSIKEWCARNGQGEARYYYWQKRVREEAIKSAQQNQVGAELIRVEPDQMVVGAEGKATAGVELQPGIVVRYGQAVIEYRAGTQAREIAMLLKALDEL